MQLQPRVPIEKCSIAHALDVVGDRWILLIMREAFYGVKRFDTMQKDLAIPRTVLSKRLSAMVEHGLLERSPYHEDDQRRRHEYLLTEKGVDLLVVLIALMQWGDKYENGNNIPSLRLMHKKCGSEVVVEFVCEAGHLIKDQAELTAKIEADISMDRQ